jgi:hypothetical protein
VEIASQDDVESFVELEALLFAEDAGVHDPHVDVTWPEREEAADFQRLLADDNSVARRLYERSGFAPQTRRPSARAAVRPLSRATESQFT